MRKLLIGLGLLIVLVVGGVLIVPGMIDWNTYKAEITHQVKTITGRDLVIGGDIKITVLPAPAIIVEDVAFANVEGGSDGQMVLLDSLAVNVALGPLITGDVQVTKVRLVNPVVFLEVLADGRQNWVLEGLDEDGAAALANGTTPSASIDLTTGETVTEKPSSSTGPALQLDNFEIVNGTVVYRDATSAVEEQIHALNATFKAASLSGPFESIGSLELRGIPVSYEIGVDGVFQGRTVPVTAAIRSEKADASLRLSGNVVNLSEHAKFTGSVKAEGQSIAALMAAVASSGALPGALHQPFSLEGQVAANVSSVTVEDMVLKLGETSASGLVDVDLSDGISAAVDVMVNHANLDKILALDSYSGMPSAASGSNAASQDTEETSSGASLVNTPSDADAAIPSGPITIPTGVNASLALGIEAITYQGQKVGPVRVNAELANGEVTLSQFSSQLPGATDVYLSGFATMQDGKPVFDGESELSIGDTHGLADWLRVDLSALPNGRMRRVDARATIRASMEDVQISGVDVSFDGSHLKGGVTIALRKRPAFGASFVLDRIDLAGYLPSDGEAKAVEPANDNTQAATGETQTTGADGSSSGDAAVEAPNPLAVLSALTQFDANLKAEIGEIVYQGQPIRKVAFDGTLYQGDLSLKKASVADLAGASASMAGTLSELGGNPRFSDFRVRFNAKSIAGLADFLALELPMPPKALGAVAAAVTVDGALLRPTFKALGNAAGAQVTFDGYMSVLPIKDLINGEITVKHDDVAGLLRALGVAYRPSGNIGGINLSTKIAGDPSAFDFDDMSGALGALKFTGDTKLRLSGDVPKVMATISTNAFSVDPFLPAKQSASLIEGGGTEAFGVTARPVVTAGAPWSDDPLDLSALKGLNGDFRVRSEAIEYDGYRLQDADIIATLTDGILKADRVSGNVFGGRVNLKGLVNAQSTPKTEATLSFENASVSSLLSSITGAPTAAGALTFETALSASGISVADMVAALNGNGSFAVKGLDVQGSAKGTPFAGLLGLVQSFGQLGSGLSGQSMDGLADVTGSYTLTNGVAQIGDFRLLSGLGNGAAAGAIDLAGWQMNVSGTLKLAQSILGQLLAQKAGAPQELPFTVVGSLDSPTVKLETASLDGSDGTLPGLDKLDEKVPGLGGLLQGVLGGTLGGGTQQQQQTPPAQSGSETQSGLPEPQPQQQPQQQEITPEDVLKQLLQF